MTWKNKKVLITGATHFVGSHLAEKLVMLGSNVKAFIRYDYQNDWGSLDRLPVYIKNKIEVIPGSLTNPEAIDYAVENTEIVFHFGVLEMFPLHINVRDYLEKTIIGTFNVLNAVKKYSVQKLVHISTARVYGEVKEVPIDEKCPLKAQSPHISSDIKERTKEMEELAHEIEKEMDELGRHVTIFIKKQRLPAVRQEGGNHAFWDGETETAAKLTQKQLGQRNG